MKDSYGDGVEQFFMPDGHNTAVDHIASVQALLGRSENTTNLSILVSF